MAASFSNSSDCIRLRVRASGAVQGVGFRPYVHAVATDCHVSGSIANVGGGVEIHVEGVVPCVQSFVERLRKNLPPHACIRSLQVEELPPLGKESGFSIAPSLNDGGAISILPDLKVCDECLAELFARKNRRSGYGLITCTHCGPRFSILQHVPFDRPNTTLAAFPLCAECSQEYQSPKDRRFHAQSIACETCGPRIRLTDSCGRTIGGDPIAQARRRLLAGDIVAIKGIGGFHLAVRADSAAAVQRLRRWKGRAAKPFAVMVGSLTQARKTIQLSSGGECLLRSDEAPIVLAPRTSEASVADEVAPGLRHLGIMLPYTPIQHLLFSGDMPPLVMTSANDGGEPIVFEDAAALDELKHCIDAMLTHDRPIARGIDDSVAIDLHDLDPILLRRARGYVPSEFNLPIRTEHPGLAMGGDLKSTFALVRDGDVILSQHLGDLEDVRSFERFTTTIEEFQVLFGVAPKWIVRDAHPKYFSSQHARSLATRWKVPLLTVQHHHAHAASVLAEHGISEKTLCLICDGTGYGADGTIWGGELLLADLTSYRRLARLRPLRLPGGDAAARETARCAMALVLDAYGPQFDSVPHGRNLFESASDRELVELMLRSNVSCAASSGAGRYFDGISALLGLCSRNTYEGQAAMMLEAAAGRAGGQDRCSNARFNVSTVDELLELDFAPFVRDLCENFPRQTVDEWAAEFHEQFVRGWVEVIRQVGARDNHAQVAVSGGVFCNALLVRRFMSLLEPLHLKVIRNRQIPPNDGGVALGQAAIASAILRERPLTSEDIPCV